jgi:hypothetical protein
MGMVIILFGKEAVVSFTAFHAAERLFDKMMLFSETETWITQREM